MYRSRTRILVSLLVLTSALALTSARATTSAGSCAAGNLGGSWPSYGHDLANSRTGTDAGVDAATTQALAPRWKFNVADFGGAGNLNSTPTVADGCIFFATDNGDVFALNADDGSFVWKRNYVVGQTRLGGVIASAISIDNGLAIIDVSDAGHPYVTAVDELTGQEVWRTIVDTRVGSFINASPVVFNGMVFVGFAGDEYAPYARGGYAFVRESDGLLLKATYTISDAQFDDGYWGGSVWSSAAVDAANGYVYAGTGNPSSHPKEDPNTNAILKIDAKPTSTTFGEIVGAYKGVTEQDNTGLEQNPACEAAPDVTYGDAWSLTCAQFDLDFGASPTLYTNSHGAQMVGALQKAGVFHAVDTASMTGAWTDTIGTPCFICNAASPANDNGKIVTAATMPGQLFSLAGDDGTVRWASPLADVVHYDSVSINNGVAFVIDFYGNLNAYDEATGLPLMKRNIGTDVGTAVPGTSSAGVSIARNKVYVPAAGYLIAYH